MKASKINQLEKLERLYKNGRVSEAEYLNLRGEIVGYTYSEKDFQQQEGSSSKSKLLKWALILGMIWMAYLFLFSNKSPKKAELESTDRQAASNADLKQVIDKNLDKAREVKRLEEERGRQESKMLDNLF